MPRIPIFRLGRSPEEALPPKLGTYTPKLVLEDLQLGVDNLRHDVHLSPRFVEQARLQIARLIVRHGDMEGSAGRRDCRTACRYAVHRIQVRAECSTT